MSAAKHTPGPWRWEFNAKHKSMHLVGGVPTYDLTVMDFDRWGMSGAVVRLREDVDRMNIMHRLCDRPEWIAPLPNREHHSSWCAGVTHPDMRLIEAAPDMLEALRDALSGHNDPELFLPQVRAAIAKATGSAS